MSHPATIQAPLTTRPTWAEIRLSTLQKNFHALRAHLAGQAEICAIVKANAYSHGLVPCARALAEAGALSFGVTCAEEGAELRSAGVNGQILLMSGFFPGQEESVIQNQLTPSVWSGEQLDLLEQAARKLGCPPRSLPVHIKVDTGMTRLGADLEQLPQLITRLLTAEYVSLEGLLSHLAAADVVDAPQTTKQLQAFDQALAQLTAAGLEPRYRHVANTSALLSRRDCWHNLVRPGLALYGYALPLMSLVPGTPAPAVPVAVEPALSWKTRVMSLRQVPERRGISYNSAYITQSRARIAALPVGYGDGLNRRLSSAGRVIIRGEYAPMVGNITMDITLIDVSVIPGVEVGDEVMLLGATADGARQITAWEHACLAETIVYEILCNISARVPRRYV